MACRYIIYAVVIHLAILTVMGSWVVLNTYSPLPDFVSLPKYLLEPAPLTAKPPSPIKHRTEPDIRKPPIPSEPWQTQLPSSGPTRVVLNRQCTWNLLTLNRDGPLDLWQKPTRDEGQERHSLGKSERDRLGRVWSFGGDWVDRTRPRSGGIPHSVFTCYQARYADGDWNCNPTALENMLAQTVRWSKDRIQASVQPQAISVGSDEIFKTRPPFLFLTGHKDFHFTNEEVKNLREYLMLGGTLWADNSLPGRHSRFDEAFRREMKRVIPDREFEVVPKNHPVFHAHFKIKDIPAGMNYYAEPIEHIRVSDESIVLYTQNAYSDLWETALNENDNIDTDTYLNEETGALYTRWGPHWGNYLTGFLYRNVDETSIRDANRLALNIIVHLLTQYEDKFRMIGKM
jgi:hypothetical protein